MIHPTQVKALLQNQPFRPFRIVMNSGKTYDVRHPEFVTVGRSWINVYESDDPASGIVDRFEIVSLMLMERIEFIGAKPEAMADNSSATL